MDALSALYPVAHKLKFLSKGELGRDYGVMQLEALWWADDMEAFTAARDKSLWNWTLMNMVGDWITQAHVESARTMRSISVTRGVPRRKNSGQS